MSLIGPEGLKQLRQAAGFLAAGLVLAVAIAIGYLGGLAIDDWLGTGPYIAYLGFILGVVAGFRNLFLLARTASRASTNKPDDPPS